MRPEIHRSTTLPPPRPLGPPGPLPPVGQGPIVLAGLAIGILLMAIQLWLLTVALDLLLAGNGHQVWQTALVSGLIFLGGLGMVWLLQRRPHIRGRTAR